MDTEPTGDVGQGIVPGCVVPSSGAVIHWVNHHSNHVTCTVLASCRHSGASHLSDRNTGPHPTPVCWPPCIAAQLRCFTGGALPGAVAFPLVVVGILGRVVVIPVQFLIDV